jgi:bifunctional UDP-N-acetylglucosamine pyrophosphorylase/glucosamine-1-phosphate N-acetyltransferase
MSRYRPLSAVVLAAGEGTRMRSSRPKPLHVLCGRPMLLHVLDALTDLPVDRTVVVVGHAAERVSKFLQDLAPPELGVECLEQRPQRGTGDAASVALTAFPDDDVEDGDIVVLPADTPLLRPDTVAALVRRHRVSDAAATLLTAQVEDPTGYGRVVRTKDDDVSHIVEEVDAIDEEREIGEVATSVYCFRRSVLAPALRRLSPDNAQGEYYLTDVVGVLHDAGYPVAAVVADDPAETSGINDRAQLAEVEAELRRRINHQWLREGVTMIDPRRTCVDAFVQLAPDVTLFPGTMLKGYTVVGAGAQIGPDTHLVDCAVGDDAVVEHTVGRDAEVGAGAVVGPFAYLPPGSHVGPGERTGPHHVAHTPDDAGPPR